MCDVMIIDIYIKKKSPYLAILILEILYTLSYPLLLLAKALRSEFSVMFL